MAPVATLARMWEDETENLSPNDPQKRSNHSLTHRERKMLLHIQKTKLGFQDHGKHK